MLSPEELKQRYMQQWERGNRRERLVYLLLNTLLPDGFRAELTGLGAGENRYIDRSYGSLEEAFDITLYYHGKPCCFLDVTGVKSPRDAKPNIGYCIGEWKIEKAKKYGVIHQTWAVFVIDDELAFLFAPVKKFDTVLAKKAYLYKDERPVKCLPRARWLRWNRFKQWLIQYGPVYAKLLQQATL